MDKPTKPTEVIDFYDFVRKILEDSKLNLGFSELASITEVPQNKLRYWSQKGYIQPCSAEKKNQFKFDIVFQIYAIKFFQNKGFTLAVAAKKASYYSQTFKDIKKATHARLQEIKKTPEYTLIDLGLFDPEPSKNLCLRIEGSQSRFELN
ncbi:transcriptional regulator [Liquorilactobacillus sucicola DSM 21376 = JCM 15457]|uniref:HTH merR-type domain-containing protein n=1 Tax=Liquorilactobacillus sucicola DSM 21376 = JCM 15457 TaxID=1423806 RepID=A0A023CXS0_9LACO|nr:MerR family transcriptional regulator [Liquorilactobacillus sucicola]KRN07123.1 hypothetical protein FD15_GL000694 [Liquorilactobacillus sucicola DSM 21376 = JCM 15457]GAJ26619.1 transcriptional regulator [Liquorilactobacillus sucicola DSM 21376 = JCM 15457]